MSFRENLRKYWDYVFELEGFNLSNRYNQVSTYAVDSYRTLRGECNPRTIIIHGIMKRSGTVYVGELLSLHPDCYAHPNNIWEVPFLPLSGDLVTTQKKFFRLYDRNVDRIGPHDFLPMFGGALIHYLYTHVPSDKRMVLKIPSVEYLNNFYSVFPEEDLLVLIRDGRDVVASTIKTWPQIQFSIACRRWNQSAKMVLACDELFSSQSTYWLAKYEDAVEDPEGFVSQACTKFNLDPDLYPFERINRLKVIGSSTTIRTGETWVKKTKDFNPIGRWQQWSAWKKSIFKLIAGKSLVRLGYAPDLTW